MTKEEVAAALKQTDQLGRDVAERVVIGFSKQSASEINIANALCASRRAVIDRISILNDLGLVRTDGVGWQWMAGPVSDFHALRQEANYA